MIKRVYQKLPGRAKETAVAARNWFISSSLPRYIPFLPYTYAWERPSAIIMPSQKLIYVPIPKVANRSIKAALADTAGMPYTDPHDAGWQTIALPQLANLNGYFRFTFIRNPLDRLLSCYAQKMILYGRQLNMPVLFWRYGRRFHPHMSFAEFVEAVADIPDHLADRHFRSQHTFLFDNGELLVDFVGRYEQLTQDWSDLRQRTGLGELPHYNRSPHKPYAEMFTPELAQLAAKRYEQDIALFAYAAEIEPLL
jgi:hypothetical protein